MSPSDPSEYALGHSDRELDRLSAQARFIEPATRQFFREAGLVAGMRVLDVGSGAGDVALLAAELVGSTGEVVGTDNVAAAVAAAKAKAMERGVQNVSFRQGDPTQMTFDRPFDAAVGRYVLLFQPDQAAAVRKLAERLRAGGVIVFHEPDWGSARSMPVVALYDRLCHWIQESFRLTGADTNMADRLYTAFVGAGLTPTMRMQTVVGGGPAVSDFLRAAAGLVTSMLPAIERFGLATAAEVDPATLADRLIHDVTASGGIIVGRSEVGAWSRV